jgi:uncharacterized protein YlbG (UPF0298 family)
MVSAMIPIPLAVTLLAVTTLLLLSSASLADDSVNEAYPGYRVFPRNPPNEGILFVNHAPANRSGHLGHALVEYEDGKLISLYPNCSADNKGHSAVGWMEYKRSEDAGETWGQPQVLTYSRKLFDAGQEARPGTSRFSAFAEKAVRTDNGEIVLFFLVCDITKDTVWRRFQRPTCISSSDGGHTWSDALQLCKLRGRVYDARYDDGEILVMFFANDNEINFLGNKPEHVYQLLVSRDGGRSFSTRSVLPFNTMARAYGTMGRLASGELIAYVYNRDDEYALDYVVSNDVGRTWSDVKTSRFAKRIRNPQMNELNGAYFMFGRSGSLGKKKERGHMVLYSSQDGITWDHGIYLRKREAGLGAYANGLVVGSLNSNKRNRLLIQTSHAYELNRTNVMHWWVDVHGSDR